MSALNRWFPLTHQVLIAEEQSDNYFRSIWIGLTAGILNFPSYIFTAFFRLLTGSASLALCGKLLFTMLIVLPILGLRNMIDSADITVEEMYSRLDRELNGEDF